MASCLKRIECCGPLPNRKFPDDRNEPSAPPGIHLSASFEVIDRLRFYNHWRVHSTPGGPSPMASRKNGLLTTKGSPHNPSEKLDAKAWSRFGLEVQERIMNDIALGFRNADGEMLNELVHCLDFMNGLPFFKAYKAHTWETLKIRSGQKILDVACGIGFDVIRSLCLLPTVAEIRTGTPTEEVLG